MGHLSGPLISIRNIPTDGLRSKLVKAIHWCGFETFERDTTRVPKQTQKASKRGHTLTPKARPRRTDYRRLDPHSRLGLPPQASRKEIEKTHGELVSFLEGAPNGLRRWAEGEIAAADDAFAALSGSPHARKAPRARPLRRLAVAVVTLAVAAGVVVGVYQLGGGKSEGSTQSTEASAHRLSPGDEARISELMRQVKANPKDAGSLVELGNIFFKAGDYKSAGEWMQQGVAADPTNVDARLALGASKFNLGDVADARRNWLQVIASDPKNVEAYYDLGFLYVSGKRPDLPKAKQMWQKVVALAPNSAVAKTVAMHLKNLEKAASTATTPPGGKG
jgi:cytochrome c-type biogenesis protein CcmH/NrfG